MVHLIHSLSAQNNSWGSSHVLGPKPGINTHPKKSRFHLNHVQQLQNFHPHLVDLLQEVSPQTIKIVWFILSWIVLSSLRCCFFPGQLPESFCIYFQKFWLNWVLSHFSFVTPFCISEYFYYGAFQNLKKFLPVFQCPLKTNWENN